MAGTILSLALIVAASLTVGQAALTVCARREDRAVAGPVGLAILLAVAAILAGLGGRGLAIAIALAAVTATGAAVLILRGLPRVGRGERVAAIAASLTAALVAAIPFIAAGAVGILGVGLVNDDMASHLLLTDWIEERFRPEPVLIDQGYPIGPHALVAGLAELTGAHTVDVFAGLILALPGLTAFAIAAYLREVRPVVRVGVAVVAALPYLAAAYLAQAAFKEPMLALLALGFALLLPGSGSARRAIPLGLLAAGTIYVYSFPGLAWLAGTALVWGALELLRGRRPTREAILAAVAAVSALAVLAALDLGRLFDFADFRALDPDRANEGGLGNLRGHISPLEALGIWPTSEFRLPIAASSVPAAVFYLCGLFGLVAFGLALPRWLRRYGTAIPAALITAVALYVAARAFGTVYTSAKALAIAAPFVTLITLGGLLSPGAAPRSWTSRALPALALVFALGCVASSFLILRQAPVAPEAHPKELEQIRPLVEGKKLLFLGRDNFVLWELRGSRPFVAVRNFYVPNSLYVEPNTELDDVFAKFDFDSVTGETLAQFPYVLTTRAAYASGPPPGYERVSETDSYVLWRRGPESPAGRLPGEDDAAPGRLRGCDEESARRVAAFSRPPVVGSDWSQPTIDGDDLSAVQLDLPAGTWELSLQYDATREVTLVAPGFDETLPANLDYRGSTPFWAVGTIETDGGPLEVTATVEEPPLAGRLLGADSVAHLGALAATAADGGGRPGNCDDYVDWYEARTR